MPQMNADFLFQDAQNYQLLRQNHWQFTLQGIDCALLCDSMKLPKTTVGTVVVPYGNDETKVAGKAKTSNGSVVIRDAVAPDIVGALNSWFLQVFDPVTGKMTYPHKYRKSGEATLYDIEGNLIRTVKFSNVWLDSQPISDNTYSWDNADIVKIAVNLIMDHVYYDSSNAGGASSGVSTS